MDVFLAVASKRDVRKYADRPLPDDVVRRILNAGRLAGSSRNRQPWQFVVVERRELVESLAEAVYAPSNLLGAALVVAVVVTGSRPAALDTGRAAQNMMLTAWNEGVVSCPNGLADGDRAGQALALGDDERVQIVLSFGYPARARDAERHSADEWSARANRKPLDELVRRL